MAYGYGKKKETGPRENYANWAGYGADPERDPELFASLPVEVQREKLELRQVMKEHPEAQAFEIHDPSTGKPYPGQVLMSDLLREAREKRQKLPSVPDWYRYQIPNGVPLALLETPTVDCRWTPEKTQEVLTRLEQVVTMEALSAALRDEQGLKATKPVNGLFAFVWRIVRYNAGLDAFTPVTCFLDLQDGLGRLGIRMPDYESLRPVIHFLRDKAEKLADEAGFDKYVAAQRFARGQGLAR